jgi:hypothetical protein
MQALTRGLAVKPGPAALDPGPPQPILALGTMTELKELSLWAQLALFYLWAIFMVAIGVYALTMKHSKLWVAILIKTLGAIALLWGLWELFATTATLVRGLCSA